jgi:hypothetical protein
MKSGNAKWYWFSVLAGAVAYVLINQVVGVERQMLWLVSRIGAIFGANFHSGSSLGLYFMAHAAACIPVFGLLFLFPRYLVHVRNASSKGVFVVLSFILFMLGAVGADVVRFTFVLLAFRLFFRGFF